MKLLLDENMPHDFRHLCVPHDVFTVWYMGWGSLSDARILLKAAEVGFDVVITLDNGFAHQHKLPELPISVVILRPRSSIPEDVCSLAPQLLRTLESLENRTIVFVPPLVTFGEKSSL